MLKSRGFGDEGSRRRILDGFAAHGIGPQRIDLIEASQPLAAHLAMYGQIDIALDTFPYHGTTTTCEALWMGVPVVSLIGQTHVSRVGLSLLSAVGLKELTATTAGSYVMVCKGLAENIETLRTLRRRIRKQMLESPLCDATRLARAMEAVFRQTFALWARGISSSR